METFRSLSVALLSGVIAAQEVRSVQDAGAGNPVFDPQRQRVVVCGAGNYSREWDGTAWRQAPDLGSPGPSGASGGHAFWDAANNRLAVVNNTTLYTRTGHRWQSQPLSSGGLSPNFDGSAYAYDSGQGRLLRFGGSNDLLQLVDETWQFRNGTWSPLQPSVRPGARVGAAMAYDPQRQRAVLFGGYGPAALNDTWEWDGVTWAPIATPVQPTALPPGGMAYDAARQRMVLFLPVPPANSQIWEYDGTTWLQRPVPPIAGEVPLSTATSSATSLVYDPVRGAVLHASATSSSDPWTYDGAAWSPRPGLPLAGSASSGWAVAANASGIHKFGGDVSGALSDELWRFDANGWRRLAVGGPSPRQHASMWAQQGNLFVFGGEDASSQLLGDTWRWNGTAWSQVTSAVSPSARSKTQVAYDPVADQALLFSGFGGAGLWSFDGQQWQQIPVTGGPVTRWDHGLVYDPSRNRTVLAGGKRIGAFGVVTGIADTWEWNGTVWQQTLGSGSQFAPSAIAYDADSQQLLCLVGPEPNFSVGRYTGSTWDSYPVLGDTFSSQPLHLFEGRAVVTAPSGRFTVVARSQVAELVQAPAVALDYGFACGAPALQLTANGLPRLGDAAFALDMALAPPSAPAVLGLATAPASIPFAGCVLWIAPGFVTASLATDPQGRALQPLPLPGTPSLLGAELFGQALALSSSSPAGFVLSPGLGLRLGQ